MNIYHALSIVDEFETRYGSERAMKRACLFLARYLSLARESLPEIARPALDAAQAYLDGRAELHEVREQRLVLAEYLSSHSAWTLFVHPIYGPINAAHALVWYLEKPNESGQPSEVISNSIDATTSLRLSEQVVRSLLRECFSN